MAAGVADFAEILAALLSGDNAVRKAAEQRYETCKREQPHALLEGLLQVLSEPKLHEPVREQAAVLLRQQLTLSKAMVASEVFVKLLILLEAEAAAKVRRKLADCISSVGNKIADIDEDQRPTNIPQWPALLPTLMRIITDSSRPAGLRADALRVVKDLAPSIWPVLVASAEQTRQVISACISDAAEEVKTAAACLFCGLAAHIAVKEERKPFIPLLSEFFQALSQLASSTDTEKLKSVLQAVILVNEDCADFFRDCLASHYLPFFCQLAKSHGDADVRKQSLEVLCSAVEGKPKMMLKVPKCLESIFDICAMFMMDLDDDLETWASNENDEKNDAEEQPDVGANAVDRISKKLHELDCFHQALVVLAPAIARLLQQSTWKQVVAGLVIMRQIIEYVDETTLDQMLQAVLPQLTATHPRIRNAAWGCVQEFAINQEDVAASEEWTSRLLPQVVIGLDDACPRNVVACMQAFHHYGEHVDRDGMAPVAQTFMEKLGQKLQGNHMSVSREAITFIAVIAQQIQDAFEQYYAPLMPILKGLIANTIHKVEERILLGKAFECVSLLANTVSRETFRPDAEMIMESMIKSTQVPGLPQDDPVKEYAMAAAERICSTLREEFLPFVPHFLPLVFSKLRLTPIEYDATDMNNDSIDADNCSLAVVAGEDGEAKILFMSSSELEDVQHAVECLHTFVEKLGPKYIPYVTDTAKALLPVFEFSMKEEVRDMAFETWGQLCHAARAAGQAEVVAELVREFLNRIVPKLELPLVDLQAGATMANGVKACLAEAGPDLLNAEQVRHITGICLKVVTDSFSRTLGKNSSTEDCAAEDDADDDDDTDDGGEQGEEMLLRQAANNIATSLMTHHPDLFASDGLPLYLPFVQKLLQPGQGLEDRQLSCFYILSSFGEQLGGRVVPHWPLFLPQLLENTTSKSGKIRMAACYACSFFAREGAFAPFAADTARKLAEMITQTRARGKKKSEQEAQMAADNALSALMEILLHHEAEVSIVKDELWKAWVAGLPCQEDNDEGQRNHGTLVQLVQKQKAEVVGADGSNIPRLLSILVDVYKTEMVDDVANWCIGQLFTKVGQQQLDLWSASFSVKQRSKLVRALRDAQKSAAVA